MNLDRDYSIKSFIWTLTILLAFLIYWYLNPQITPKTTGLLFFLCFFCELVDSSIGMGYGTLLTPLLLFSGFTPLQIVPHLLIAELFSGFSSAFFHHQIKNADFHPKGQHLKIVLLLAVGSVAGSAAGIGFLLSIPENIVVAIIGCIIFFTGLMVVLFYNKVIVYKNWKIMLVATVAAFNKAFSGGGYGPLVTSGQILSGVKGRPSVAITSFSEGFTCLLGTFGFYAAGVAINPDLLAPMLAGSLMSVPLSAFLVSRIDEGYLRTLVGAATILLGILTIYQAA